MKLLIVAALAVVAWSSSSHWSLERPLQAKTDYHYRYDGSIMTGIPVQNTDMTLTRIQANAHVQMIDDRTMMMRLKDIRMAASHTEEPSKQSRTESLNFMPLDALEERELAEQHQKMLEEPVKCVYRNGLISEIQFSSEDEAWSKNIKRSVLNMLQINLDKSNRVEKSKDMIYDDMSEEMTKQNDFYSVVEKTLEGDCEVAYTIVREQEWTTVTKSINFDKCTSRPDIKYGMRFESDCEDCEKQADLVQPETVYTYRIEKDTIKTVDVRSIYSVSLKDEPIMKTEIKARLTLEKQQQIGSQIPHPKGSEQKEEMIYSNEWEEMVESFFKNGDNTKLEMPFEKYETSYKMQRVRKILEKIVERKENKPETSHEMARLVRVFRMCSLPELEKIHTEYYKKHDERVRLFVTHAMAIAGTHNTIKHLIRHIESKECSPIKAAQYLKAIQETPYPSERIAEMIVKLAEKSENEPVLRQSAWLCAGTIVRGVVAENRDDQIVNENKREIKQKFIRVFMKEFETAEGVYEKVLALKTLANAGIDLSVFDLQKIIYDKREQLAVRIEAIDALRLLKDEMPRKIQQVLMPIYKNRFEAPELRMAALVKIMHTLPTQPILSQIVFQMERESSQQVAAFTYYMLQTLAKSTSPCHQTISQDISTLLTFTRFQPQENYYSTFLHLPLFSEEFLTGASLNLGALFGKDSYIPKELSASLNTVFGGNWNKYLAQIGFSQQNLDVILEKIVRKLYNMEKESTTVVRGRRVQQSLNLLKELSKKISVKARESNYRQSSEKPHAMLYFRYKEMDFAVLPLDDKVLDEIVEKYIDNGRIEQRQLDRLFNRDHEFEMHHAAFFYEATRKMPTSMGLPLTISGKLPTVFSAEGKLVMEMLPLGVRFHLKIQPSLAATHITQMRFWAPHFEQGVKMLTSVEAQTPVEIKAELTLKGQLEFNYVVAVPEQKKVMLRAHRRPVGFLRFPNKNIMEHVEPEEKTLVHPMEEQLTKDIDYTMNVLGMHVQTRGNILRFYSVENIAFVEQQFELIAESRGRRNEIMTRVVIEPVESGRIEKISTSYEKMFEDEFEPEDSEYSIRRNEKERREHFQKRVRDIESGEGYKHRMTVRVEANKEKTAEIEIRTQCDREIRYCRVNFDGRRQPMLQDERNEWTIKGEAHLALPEMPRNFKEMKEQKHREVQAFVEAKWGCEKKSQLSMKVQLEQDKEQNKWLQHAERKEQLSGMNAYEVLVKAGRLNKLNLVAEYELSRQSETVFRRIYDIVKAYGFWSSQWESRQGEEGRVLLQLTVDPISRRYANLTVQTPSELLRMHTVRLPTRMPLVSIARRSIRESFDYTTSNKAECEVKSTRVNTFDDVVYRTPLTTCFSVIAKDCSEEPRFAVLAKKINKNSEELKVKIIDEEGNKIELENKKDEIEIRVNGKVIRKESELENYGIEKMSEDMIRVNLDNIEVRFDGYTVKTHMSRRFQEQQCGLCGHFDGEMDNEFRMANDESTEDIEEFHRSFLVKGEECEIEEERVSEKKNYKNYRRESEYNNYEAESSSESEEYDMPERYNEKKYERDNSEYDEDEEMKPVERTRVVEYSHRICFSKEPVMECPRRAKDGKTQEKKMQFTCLPREQSEARRMLREARDGKVLRLTSYPNSYVESIEMPKTCIVY